MISVRILRIRSARCLVALTLAACGGGGGSTGASGASGGTVQAASTGLPGSTSAMQQITVATDAQRRIRQRELAMLDEKEAQEREEARKNKGFTQVYPLGWKRIIELAKGKTAVETTPAELINTLTLLKNATAAGELDAQMDAASAKVRKDFKGGK